MFNALPSVRWLWSAGEVARASKLFKQFVELWKHHWQDASHVQHSLNEELHSLRAYMDLEEVRLQRIVSRTEIVAEDVDIRGQIPVLLLQPVIENALWHGFSEMPHVPKLEIRIERLPREGDLPWVRMTVRDYGVGIREQGNHRLLHRQLPPLSGTIHDRKRVKDVHPEAWFEVRNGTPWSTEAQFACLSLCQTLEFRQSGMARRPSALALFQKSIHPTAAIMAALSVQWAIGGM